jgi:hypothetical protein
MYSELNQEGYLLRLSCYLLHKKISSILKIVHPYMDVILKEKEEIVVVILMIHLKAKIIWRDCVGIEPT